MSDEDLEARVSAVERALTDGESMPDLSDAADAERRLADLEAEVTALSERLDALDATVQSLHGYVGDLEHVNERVERRADAARAAVERLEGQRSRPARDSQPESSTASTDTTPARAESELPDHEEAEETLVERVRDAL